jgi:hypothetical protein
MASADETKVGSDVPDASSFAYLRWRTFHDMARLWSLLVFAFTAVLLGVISIIVIALVADATAGAALAVVGGVAELGVVRFAVKRRQEALEEEEKASRAVFAYSAPAEEGPDGSRATTSGRSRGWRPPAPSGW